MGSHFRSIWDVAAAFMIMYESVSSSIILPRSSKDSRDRPTENQSVTIQADAWKRSRNLRGDCYLSSPYSPTLNSVVHLDNVNELTRDV